MNNKNTYTGSKVRNSFTAYLLGQIRGRRKKYLEKKIKIHEAEFLAEDFDRTGLLTDMDELMEQRDREELLAKEAEGSFPKWDELSDQKLMLALMQLRETERKLIYQHVFEQLTFEEMSNKTGKTIYQVKNTYYRAVEKIRNRMRGDK